MLKTDPKYLFPFTFDISEAPECPKPLPMIMKKRTDEKAIKIQNKHREQNEKFIEWLEKAKWYLACKAYDKGRMSDEIMESFNKVSNGVIKTVSLLSAYNQVKDYYTKNRKR